MTFARTEGQRGAFALTQSGMPPADARLFDGLAGPDLVFAGKEALPLLQARIAEHVGVRPEHVLVTLGASGAMHVTASALFRPGVRVASETPSYEPLRALPVHFGAELREVERRDGDGWQLDPAEVRRALTGAKTGHVFITNPHNPSGAMLGPDVLRALAAEAERAGGALICNEIYIEYAPDGRRLRAHDIAPNVITLGSMTKAYGLGALRIGWIAFGAAMHDERERFLDAIYLDYVDPATVAVRCGLRAFERMREMRTAIEALERDSKPQFARWLERADGIRAQVPEFGLIAFPRIEGVDDTLALGRYLADEHEVGVVPGEFFGRAGHVRVGFGLPKERLSEALRRFERGVAAFRKL
jgi:aspartate/methionine/tyrosine aminotransferase